MSILDPPSGDLDPLVHALAANPHELEWVEFKENNVDPQEIGEYVSALSNSAALHGESRAFLVWGIRDGTHEIVGTSFKPGKAIGKGAEPLVPWLSRLLSPRIDVHFREGNAAGHPVVVLEIPAASHTPIRFSGEEYIRVGSQKRKLRDFPEKERGLWHRFTRTSFESGIARDDLGQADVLGLLDFSEYFDLADIRPSTTPDGIVAQLVEVGFVVPSPSGRFAITNLGAITLGKPLKKLGLERKAVRVIVYGGDNRTSTIREQEGTKGYGSGFRGLMQFIAAQLPTNELIGQALRRDEPMYPELAVRELVANALIHQDFSLGGTGPMVEIFTDRIEVTNPGRPLIDPIRFLDSPARSRNEKLAMMMRRLGICEERGSGIDKVVTLAELYQLPAPDFIVTPEHTTAMLFSPRPLSEMTKADRVRACYQHAGLRWVARKELTNASLRDRFGISHANSAIASRIIGETVEAEMIKPADPENKSRKLASYIPFWA